MNRLREFVVVFVTLLVAIGCSSNTDKIESLKQLGMAEFTQAAWAEADQLERGEMVYDLLKSEEVIGMPIDDVYKLLGKSTVYYDHDNIPAYLVGPPNADNIYGNGYVLAFISNGSSGVIEDFIFEPGLPSSE